MEPPLIAAEEVIHELNHESQRKASMEPPLIAAEEVLNSVDFPGAELASMEPPLIAAEEGSAGMVVISLGWVAVFERVGARW